MSSKLTDTEHLCGFCKGQLYSSMEIVNKIHKDCKTALKSYSNINTLIEEFHNLNDKPHLNRPLSIEMITEIS